MLAVACAWFVAMVWVPQAAQAAGGGQWALQEAGTVCFNLLTDGPAEGPQITSIRQPLQEVAGQNDTMFASASGTGVNVGDLMQVVRNTGVMRHPATDASVGHVIEILGVAEVRDVNGADILLHVVGSCSEFEPGDVLRPLAGEGDLPEPLPRMPVFNASVLVTPDDADAFLVMGALESLRTSSIDPTRKSMIQREAYGQRDLVVMDQGGDAAWQAADVALIYRDRIYANSDVFRHAMTVPPVLGRGIVVRADASSAVLQIVDSVGEIQIGDRARKAGNIWDYVNRAPSITCRAERNEVRIGESVRLQAQVSDPDNDPITITWQASAGSLSPSQGGSVTYTASVGEPGAVSIVATADDGGDDGRVDCDINVVTVRAPVSTPGGGGVVSPAEPEVLDFMCPEYPAGATDADNRCKAVLDEVALRMRQDPRATAELVGHSDSTGSDEINAATSLQRAEKARQYLVETHGVQASRLTVSGVGSATPIAGNDTPEGQTQNRRVEIKVTLPGGDGAEG